MILRGDARHLPLKENNAAAVVTDPPYDLLQVSRGGSRRWNDRETPFGRTGSQTGGFMGMAWDATGVAFRKETWREVARTMKPGAHLLAFGGTRTFHRLACAIEDAGFEIRDCLMWLYGSGFPKSLNIGEGRGTALKPAWEPILLARKPLSEGTVAANVLRWGTGALNVDAGRIGSEQTVTHLKDMSEYHGNRFGSPGATAPITGHRRNPPGRWPANALFSHEPECQEGGCAPDCAVALLDRQSGVRKSGKGPLRRHDSLRDTADGWDMRQNSDGGRLYGDSGGASRFFYCSKPSRTERNAGLGGERNGHPTVKPVALLRYLCRLICPPGGLLLDPFAGSGSTGIAAREEGFDFIGLDLDAEYVKIAQARSA